MEARERIADAESSGPWSKTSSTSETSNTWRSRIFVFAVVSTRNSSTVALAKWPLLDRPERRPRWCGAGSRRRRIWSPFQPAFLASGARGPSLARYATDARGARVRTGTRCVASGTMRDVEEATRQLDDHSSSVRETPGSADRRRGHDLTAVGASSMTTPRYIVVWSDILVTWASLILVVAAAVRDPDAH